MKTWEMVKELTENPDKRFVSEKGKNDEMIASIPSTCIIFSYENESIGEVEGIYSLREWEEVKQPVSFREAVESGKRILYPDLFELEEYLKLDDLLAGLIANYFSDGIKDIILNGKFYIED